MELEANSGRSSKLVVMRREDPDSDREKKLNLILPSGEEENSKFYSGLEEEWKRKAPKKPAEKKTAAEK
ncbi:hypothetical protein HY256_12795, partial [Candidatus Sumerlaeota bacterium]|nr:hypothetical protein [Candidatus Sumerlaeota bacterium]